jgi:hypothetical protein
MLDARFGIKVASSAVLVDGAIQRSSAVVQEAPVNHSILVRLAQFVSAHISSAASADAAITMRVKDGLMLRLHGSDSYAAAAKQAMHMLPMPDEVEAQVMMQ